MTDYNYFSKEAVAAGTENLREAAKRWYDYSDRMAAVATQAKSMSLDQSAFSVVVDEPVGSVVSSDLVGAYNKMFGFLSQAFTDAATDFDQMGKALKENADWYEHVDVNVAQSFDKIAAGE